MKLTFDCSHETYTKIIDYLNSGSIGSYLTLEKAGNLEIKGGSKTTNLFYKGVEISTIVDTAVGRRKAFDGLVDLIGPKS